MYQISPNLVTVFVGHVGLAKQMLNLEKCCLQNDVRSKRRQTQKLMGHVPFAKV